MSGACGMLVVGVLVGCAGVTNEPRRRASVSAEVVIAAPESVKRPPYRFAEADERLLDEIQHGAFLFMWRECSPTTGMVVDRSSVTYSSAAGVGFQLAGLPVGVERGWVRRDEAEERAVKILKSLSDNPENRKAGLFYHYLTGEDASPVRQDVVSTIDSALLFAGILTAGSYFGGEVRERGDELVAAADWSFFVERSPRPHEPHMKGYISLGWQPREWSEPTGEGDLKRYYWADSGDEHRLVTLLAIAAPIESHRAEPSLYYRLRRPLGEYKGTGLMVYLPWSGALFTAFFAHCFIDYARMGTDDPGRLGVGRRPKVDWWENSRRHVELHRIKAMEARKRFPTFGPNAWGLTACDSPRGYSVPGVYPDAVVMSDMINDIDYPVWKPRDDFGDGTVAPYGAGCAIMFEPEKAVAALRHYRSLKDGDGKPLVWRDPAGASEREGAGFKDAFLLPEGWVAEDYVAIDQGPLLLAIENARTGRVWGWFHEHPIVREGLRRAGIDHPQ
ncbi:MAG: glucoamylase family protein [Phycisphaerales bacterium]